MFEYTLSGLSFTRTTYPIVKDVPHRRELVKKFFNFANTQSENHRFSILFNGYTEEKIGELVNECYRDSVYNVHADSGGLQIITCGLQITPQMQDEIYHIQGKYSDIGMSFDEIPLKTIGKSKRNDMSTRFFDRENIRAYAKQTGKNLRRQIEVFLEDKTTCRPFFIVHGNDVDTALEWTDVALNEIPLDERKYIGGIAMGGGSFGAGEKEILLRAILAGHILETRDDIVEKKMHFLGLGSLKNTFSFISLLHSGMYNRDWHISYDSTTHSSGHHFGKYLYQNGEMESFNRQFNRKYQDIYNDIQKTIPFFEENISIETFYNTLNTQLASYAEKGGDASDFIWSNLGCVIGSVVNFTRNVDRYASDYNTFLEERIEQKNHPLYMSLLNIKNLDDYRAWDRDMGRFFPSKKLSDQPEITFDI